MNRTADIVQHFHGLRALVIGEAMLDTYLEGSATRLCREGPVPVVLKTGERRFPGGAANTAMNLRALGADVSFLSVIGADQAGASLRSALLEAGISDLWLVEDASISTQHKLRIIANGQYIVRFDEDARPPSPTSQQALLVGLEKAFPDVDLVVVSDYGYGVLADELIERLRNLRSSRHIPLLVDSKYLQRYSQSGATVITPNQAEAESLVQLHDAQQSNARSPIEGIDSEAFYALAQQLLALIDAEHVAITIAKDGVFLANRQGLAKHVPTYPVFHPNDIGAGDSFAAALALSIAAGATIEDAGNIAIDASNIAVTKRWTAVVTHQELLQRASLRDAAAQIHTFTSTANEGCSKDDEQHGHDTIDALIVELEQERQRGRAIVFTNGVFDILHAGHVQLLRQAKALGDILVVGVNSDRSAQHSKGRHRPINSERDRAALVDALDVVDYVVLFDEAIPLELLRRLRPHLYVKGGDYIDEALPEAEVVQEYGGRVVILPLAGSTATRDVIGRIVSLVSAGQQGRKP